MKENTSLKQIARSKSRMHLTAQRAGVKLKDTSSKSDKISPENEQSDVL